MRIALRPTFIYLCCLFLLSFNFFSMYAENSKIAKLSSEDIMYPNEIRYVGDLIIEGSETYVIEDTKFIIEGNIIVKDNASLVIKRSYILINNTYEQQYWVVIQDFATLWIEDSELTTGFRTGRGVLLSMNHNSKLFMNNTRCNWGISASHNSETKINNSYVASLGWGILSKVNITNSVIFDVFEIDFDEPIKLNVDLRNLKSGRVDETYIQAVGFLYLKNVTINPPNIKLGAVYELQTKVNLTISNSQLDLLWLSFPSYTKPEIRNLRSGFFTKWNLHEYVSGDGLGYNVTLINTYVKRYKLSFWGGEAKVVNVTDWEVLDTLEDAKVYVENSTLEQGYHNRGSKHTKFSNVIIREHIAFWTFSGRPGFGENRTYSVIEFANTTVGYFSSSTFIEVTSYHTALIKGNVSINVPMERVFWSPGGVIIREYPVVVFDDKEKPLANASLSLLGPDGSPVWTGATDNAGKCFFNLTFTYENYTKVFTLKLDSFNVTKEVGLLSTTPIIFSPWSEVKNLLSRAESIILWARSIGKSEDLIENATAMLAEARALYEDRELASSMELAWKAIELLSFKMDGDPRDWEGIHPLQKDEGGDAAFNYADLKAVYAVEDDEYLYIMVETYGKIENQRIFFISIDTNMDGLEDFIVISPPDKNRYILAKPHKDVYEIQYGIDKVAEFKVPLRILGYPSSVTIAVDTRNTATGEQYDVMERTFIPQSSLTFELKSPPPEAYFNVSEVKFTARATGKVQDVVLIVDGKEYAMTFNEDAELYEASIALADGVHTWLVKAYDVAGKAVKSEERVLVVDTQPPFLEIVSPEPSSTVKHAVTVKWEVADELSGVIKVEISLDGRPWIDVTGRESYAFAELPAGNHTVRLKATDGAGNTVVVIVPFNVGVTSIALPAPVFKVTGLSIDPLEVEPGEPVTITVKVSNVGDVRGKYKVELLVNGRIEETRDVILTPDETKIITFTVTRTESGIYSVEIDGLKGSFAVRETPIPNIETLLPYVIIASIVAVALFAFVLMRRR